MGTDNSYIKTNTLRERAKSIFNIFYAAKDAMDNRGKDIPELHDYTAVTDYANKRGKMSYSNMAKNPMFLDEELPVVYHQITEDFNKWHAGKYGNTDNNNFIPCGHSKCGICKSYTQKLIEQQQQTELAPPIPDKELDMNLPSDTLPAPPSVPLIDSLIFTFKNMAKEHVYNDITYTIASAFLKKHFDIPQWVTDKLNKYYSAWLGEMPTENTGEFLKINQWVGETDLKAQEKEVYELCNHFNVQLNDTIFEPLVFYRLVLNEYPLNPLSMHSTWSKEMVQNINMQYVLTCIMEGVLIVTEKLDLPSHLTNTGEE